MPTLESLQSKYGRTENISSKLKEDVVHAERHVRKAKDTAKDLNSVISDSDHHKSIFSGDKEHQVNKQYSVEKD